MKSVTGKEYIYRLGVFVLMSSAALVYLSDIDYMYIGVHAHAWTESSTKRRRGKDE